MVSVLQAEAQPGSVCKCIQSAKRRKSVPYRQLSNPEETSRKSEKSCRFTPFCKGGRKKKLRHARNSLNTDMAYCPIRYCLRQSISSLCCMTNSLRLSSTEELYFASSVPYFMRFITTVWLHLLVPSLNLLHASSRAINMSISERRSSLTQLRSVIRKSICNS